MKVNFTSRASQFILFAFILLTLAISIGVMMLFLNVSSEPTVTRTVGLTRNDENIDISTVVGLVGSTASTTFRGCDTPPGNITLDYFSKEFENTFEIIQALPKFRDNRLTEIIQSTNFSATSLRSSGFVRTVVSCYNRHLNLIIRPDDIWATIMSQFSFYVNKHAEKFRSKFVKFEGQQELVVDDVGTLHTVSYAKFVNAMTKKIDENVVDPEVKNWGLPNFSTTTENDRVTVGVIFMASMKKYFTYRDRLACGIPYITLDGTVQDWEEILGRLEKLKEYELQAWYDLLNPIITKFVEAKEGRIDKEFWNSIAHQRGGSGPQYVSGWITAFGVFDRQGNWQGDVTQPTARDEWENPFTSLLQKQWPRIDIEKIPDGIVDVNVTVEDHGVEYKTIMLAGHMAAEAKEVNGIALQPALGWVIALQAGA